MRVPEFLYQFTRAKDAFTQGLEVVHRQIDGSGSIGPVVATQAIYTVPNDRVFILTAATARIQMLSGVPMAVNTVLQLRKSSNPRYFISQDERNIQGLGFGTYRGYTAFSGELWCVPGDLIEAVFSWSVADDWTHNVSIFGFSIPRASVIIG